MTLETLAKLQGLRDELELWARIVMTRAQRRSVLFSHNPPHTPPTHITLPKTPPPLKGGLGL